MLTYILIALAAIIVVFVIIVASRPSNFRITRSTTMSAQPPVVFDLVNNFHNWEDWNPWAKMDPACKMTYDGPQAGVGASYSWAGNNKVGAGSGTIIESRPSELIRIKLDFLKPMKATNIAEFTFAPIGNQTVVNWSMSGTGNFMTKAFGLFVDCDKMVGKEFEKGLAMMKSVTEKSSNRVAVASI
jgi:hypothetical protein